MSFFARFLLIALIAPTASAQDPLASPPPADELAAFDRALGRFEGRGTVVMEHGAPELEWTGVSVVTKILGGHVIQDDTKIVMDMGPLTMRTLYAYDRERGELISYGLSNFESGPSTVRWIRDDVLLSMSEGLDPSGLPYQHRWAAAYEDDGYTFRMERSVGDGPVFEHVFGEWTRAETNWNADEDGAELPMPSDEMLGLGGMVGRYRITGSFAMTPGAPAMEVVANEHVHWLFHGAVLHADVASDDGAFEADGYIHYDSRARCLKHLSIDSMGGISMSEVRRAGRDLVFTSTPTTMGVPTVERLVLKLNASGAPTAAISHRISGAGEAFKSFDAKYTAVNESASTAPAFTPGSCCDKAVAAGAICSHPCCVQATAAGEVCQRCNR